MTIEHIRNTFFACRSVEIIIRIVQCSVKLFLQIKYLPLPRVTIFTFSSGSCGKLLLITSSKITHKIELNSIDFIVN